MTFVSLEFAILFCVTEILVSMTENIKKRQLILLMASYIFYAYWDIRFLGLLILQTFISYYLAVKIDGTDDGRVRRLYCAAGVIAALSILGFFKYFHFFVENISSIFHVRNSDALHIILPIGISFYTFQALSYLVDVYRGRLKARKDFLKVSLYIAFFPQLVAGPIVRAADFLPQLETNRKITAQNAEKGFQIFILGLFKKTVIADRLAVCVDAVFAAPAAYGSLTVILSVIAYSIQIYCDFSGYSDMAIGVAKFFGYDLCENFNVPYISKNPTEFWKRWHISLSSWLKDYLYISLGGNRKGKGRTYVNLLLTMILGGLWHGANWTFIIWGALHGTALVVHKLFLDIRGKYGLRCRNHAGRKVLDGLSMLGTYIFVCLCWVFFRAANLREAALVLKRIFVWTDGVSYLFIFTFLYGVLVFAAHLCALWKNRGRGFYPLCRLGTFRGKLWICLALWLIFIFSYNGDNAFVYFQF